MESPGGSPDHSSPRALPGRLIANCEKWVWANELKCPALAQPGREKRKTVAARRRFSGITEEIDSSGCPGGTPQRLRSTSWRDTDRRVRAASGVLFQRPNALCQSNCHQRERTARFNSRDLSSAGRRSCRHHSNIHIAARRRILRIEGGRARPVRRGYLVRRPAPAIDRNGRLSAR